jgi:exosortase/archaeosortase family protein
MPLTAPAKEGAPAAQSPSQAASTSRDNLKRLARERSAEDYSNALGFCLRFSAFAALLFAVYAFPYAEFGLSEDWFNRYLDSYAHLAGWALRLTDQAVTVHDATIQGRVALRIVKSCDAMDATLLFLAALLALPGERRKKALAAGVGVVAIAALNVVRIISLYFALGDHADAFEFLHTELWPLAMILATAALFSVCARFVNIQTRNPVLKEG